MNEKPLSDDELALKILQNRGWGDGTEQTLCDVLGGGVHAKRWIADVKNGDPFFALAKEKMGASNA